jgi:outer membrane protein assembly factor BamB
VNGGRDPANELYAPTAYAIALDEVADRIYIAGRRPATNAARANVWCLRASDGTPIWEARLAGLIQQGCLAIDPTSGNVIAAGNRNAFWYDDASASAPNGASAEVWELSASDGSVLSTFDFGDDIIGNGYIGTGYAGCGAYAIDVNTNGQRLVALAPYRYDT